MDVFLAFGIGGCNSIRCYKVPPTDCLDLDRVQLASPSLTIYIYLTALLNVEVPAWVFPTSWYFFHSISGGKYTVLLLHYIGCYLICRLHVASKQSDLNNKQTKINIKMLHIGLVLR